MVHLPAAEEGQVLDEDGSGPQDEGHEEVHVDVISGAVQLPARGRHIWDAEGRGGGTPAGMVYGSGKVRGALQGTGPASKVTHAQALCIQTVLAGSTSLPNTQGR